MRLHVSSHRLSRRGAILIESTVAIVALSVLAMLLLRASSNATSAQRWTVTQGMTDAFMTRELAIAKRIPYDDFKENGSDWPEYPSMNSEDVVIGKLVGGRDLTGTVTRTRRAADSNLTTAGGDADETTNPVEMEAWKLQSYLKYTIGGTDYVKSRTTLRVR